MSEICSKFTIKAPERRQWCVLVSLLLILNKFHCCVVSIIDFEQVNISQEWYINKRF